MRIPTGEVAVLTFRRVLTVGVVSAVCLLATGCGNSEAPEHNNGVEIIETTAFPHPGDPEYNASARISDNHDYRIGDVDQLVLFFESGKVTREDLVPALSQMTQEEADLIHEVMSNYDIYDNIKVTEILKKYGFDANEVPWNPMGRISDKNNIVELDVMDICSLLQIGRYYGGVREALQQFSHEEAEVLFNVLNDRESSYPLWQLMLGYGLDVDIDFHNKD